MKRGPRLVNGREEWQPLRQGLMRLLINHLQRLRTLTSASTRHIPGTPFRVPKFRIYHFLG